MMMRDSRRQVGSDARGTAGRVPVGPSAQQRMGLWTWLFVGQRAAILLLAFFLVADVAMISLHVVAVVRDSDNALYLLSTDQGYAEMIQYVKLAFLCVLTVVYAVQQRSWPMAAWLPLFAFLLLDDALRLHERGGRFLYEELGWTGGFGLRAQDIGELVVYAVSGFVVLVPLALGYLRGNRTVRWVYRALALLTALLLFFGVVVDIVHSLAISAGLTAFDVVGVGEDGGEALAVSLLVLFVLRLNVSGGGSGLILTDEGQALPGLGSPRQNPARPPRLP